MGILKDFKRKSAEQKAYGKILAEKTKVASRQAYAEEAVKVARERARAKARRPSLLGVATERLRTTATERLRDGPRPTTVRTPARRRTARTRVTPRKTTRRTSRTRVATRKRYAPVKTVKRTSAKAPVQTQPTGPTTLDQAIYG